MSGITTVEEVELESIKICKGCNKPFKRNSILRHLSHKSSCKSSYGADEYKDLKEFSKAKTNLKYKRKNKDKISEHGASYYAKNREAIRSKQSLHYAKNQDSRRKQYKEEKKKESKLKPVLRDLYGKVDVVNEDYRKITADPALLREAVKDLTCYVNKMDKTPVDVMFLEEETDRLLGGFDQDGKPVLDLSDIDMENPTHPRQASRTY